MPQITIYLDEQSSHLISSAAKQAGVSLSSWARDKLVQAAGAPAWPDGYASLLGSLQDDTFHIPEDRPPEKIPAAILPK